jgi:hypothetical protein
MTDSPHLTKAKRIERAARDERLSRALRENLLRRKQQARERVNGPPAAEDGREDDRKPPA